MHGMKGDKNGGASKAVVTGSQTRTYMGADGVAHSVKVPTNDDYGHHKESQGGSAPHMGSMKGGY